MSRISSLSVLLLLSFSLQAVETIESFHSDIEVRRNGDLYVTETIVVRAEGKAIKRGIFRDFPTHYKDARGRDLIVGFEVLWVTRDGRPEPFHIKDRSNGKRVYIGDANKLLSADLYEYQISYLTTRQLGFFEDFDELYWNVTGNGWAFPIEKASAVVTLPDAVSEFQLTGYTGRQGSTEQNLSHKRLSHNQVFFETSTPLARYEGLTIVAGWPKGIIHQPTAAQTRAWFVQDHKSSIIIATAALLVLIYYWLIWLRVGKDPQTGVVIPRYQPPPGFSPASMRFIQNMAYDKKCFTSAIINLAVKAAVEIDDDEGSFKVIKLGKINAPLAAGEAKVLAGLFTLGREHISIAQANHSLLSKAINKHKRSLKADYEKLYFSTNRRYLVPGILLSLIAAGFAITSLTSADQVFSTLFSGVFTLVPFMMLMAAYRVLRKRGKGSKIQIAVKVIAFMIFAGAFLQMGIPLDKHVESVVWPVVFGIVTLFILNFGFYQWLKAPTLAGRKLLDKIDGFKHYLEVAEEDEIALKDAPSFTADLFEAYLPYAIALDLDNEWTAKLNNAITSGTIDSGYRHPGWYQTHGRSQANFSKSLSKSLNSAIASSSVAPGSSSGSSGGSSGGGGGGGGGGGW